MKFVFIYWICLCPLILERAFAQSKVGNQAGAELVNMKRESILLQYDKSAKEAFNPWGPKVMCSFLPTDFLDCKEPIDHNGNKTALEEKGYGCLHFGGARYEEVEHTKVECTVYPDIECYGARTFLRAGVPCIRYTGHYFLTTLIYSILLGFLGLDRFCLGHTGTAVGKLLTFGGVGVWWIIDIILLITNNLLPEDGSNWNPVA